MATCRCTGCASDCAIHRKDVSCCGWPTGKHKRMKTAELCFWCFQESGLQVPTPPSSVKDPHRHHLVMVGAQRLGFASGCAEWRATSTCICAGCSSGCAEWREYVSCRASQTRQGGALVPLLLQCQTPIRQQRLCHYCFSARRSLQGVTDRASSASVSAR